MIKYFLLAGFLLSINVLQAQKLSVDHGEIEFYTETVLSDIDAITEKVDAILDIQTGVFEVSVSIESFEFEYELMQEHFNEDYMESEQFPLATFKGKILQNISNITKEMEVDASGEMTIHGVTKEIIAEVSMTYLDESEKTKIRAAGDLLGVEAKFNITLSDFDVENMILGSKVSDSIDITVTMVGSNAM